MDENNTEDNAMLCSKFFVRHPGDESKHQKRTFILFMPGSGNSRLKLTECAF